MTLIPTIETDTVETAQSLIDSYSVVPGPKPTHFQIDIVDGLFADMLTLMPDNLKEINWHGYTFETHLLVNDPEEYLGEVQDAGATGVIAQIEHLHDRQDFLQVAKELRLTAGLALNIYTPITELSDTDIQLADTILLLAVPAGFAGQELNPTIIDKIKQLRSKGYTKTIEIDGGINIDNIPSLIQAGATSLAVNSSLWHNGTVAENLQKLMNACHL